MLAKRIIPCLDVRAGKVVKGVRFKNHQIVGEIVPLAQRYAEEGADELVFYDITASTDQRLIDKRWVYEVAKVIDIPFCVAGGIRSEQDAKQLLAFGADKISINSPALSDPLLIERLANRFGTQCVVVGIDSYFCTKTNTYQVHQFTGDEQLSRSTSWQTMDWIKQVQQLGAGEIVLNVMNQDGVRSGYDIEQLRLARQVCKVPMIASGGAGEMAHFAKVFSSIDTGGAEVDGALAASVFHQQLIGISALKQWLHRQGLRVRL